MFVVFEGVDGSGTTTLCANYAAHLRIQTGRTVWETREPSQGPIGVLIRHALRKEVKLNQETMALLFAADRVDHVDTIRKELAAGTVVLCDRYDMSSIAYQTEALDWKGSGNAFDWVRTLNRFAIRPDITLVLDVTPEEAERRRSLRKEAPEMYEYSDLQRRLCARYARAEGMLPEDRIVTIDANKSIAEVFNSIRSILDPLFD